MIGHGVNYIVIVMVTFFQVIGNSNRWNRTHCNSNRCNRTLCNSNRCNRTQCNSTVYTNNCIGSLYNLVSRSSSNEKFSQ